MIASIIFSLAVFCALFGLYFLLGHRLEKRQWREKTKRKFKTFRQRKSFMMIYGERLDRSDYGKALAEKLSKINLPLAPSEYYIMLVAGGVFFAFVLNKVFAFNFPVNIIFAAIAMAAANQLLFIVRRQKYEEKLNDQLSDVCFILSSATRAGMTITQGIHLVAREINEPSKSEFQRIANELNLGVDFEQALLKFQKRMKGRDFRLFTVALLTQKKSGGNLHATLGEMGRTLADRKLLDQEINTLIAEQKSISYILPSIPILLVLIVNSMMEGYINALLTPAGIILALLFVAGITLSVFLVRKVTNIRV